MLKRLFGILIAGALSVGAADGSGEQLTLKVRCSGKHTAPGIATQGGYPFDLSGEVKISGPALTEREGALKAIFGSLADKSNSNSKVTAVTGDLRIEGAVVSGNVRIEWTVHGNTMFIGGDIEGSVESDFGTILSIAFKGTDVKVGGSWNWGGGVMQLGGSGEFGVSSGNEAPNAGDEKKKEKPDGGDQVCPSAGKCAQDDIVCIQEIGHTANHHSSCKTCNARIDAGKCRKRNYCATCATIAGICGGCGKKTKRKD